MHISFCCQPALLLMLAGHPISLLQVGLPLICGPLPPGSPVLHRSAAYYPTPAAAKLSRPGRPGGQALEPAWLAAPSIPAAAAGRHTSARWPSPAGSWMLCGASTSSWSCRTAPRCLLGVSWTSSAHGTRLQRLRSRQGSVCWERLSWTCLHCHQVEFWQTCGCHASAAGEAVPALKPAPVSGLQPHQPHVLMKGAAANSVMQCISCKLGSKGIRPAPLFCAPLAAASPSLLPFPHCTGDAMHLCCRPGWLCPAADA